MCWISGGCFARIAVHPQTALSSPPLKIEFFKGKDQGSLVLQSAACGGFWLGPLCCGARGKEVCRTDCPAPSWERDVLLENITVKTFPAFEGRAWGTAGSARLESPPCCQVLWRERRSAAGLLETRVGDAGERACCSWCLGSC